MPTDHELFGLIVKRGDRRIVFAVQQAPNDVLENNR